MYTCMGTHMYIYTYICMYVYINILYTHTYIHTTHTHTYIYIYNFSVTSYRKSKRTFWPTQYMCSKKCIYMATYSGILTWEIPWTEEPPRLQPMGLQRVGDNLATKPSPHTYMCSKNANEFIFSTQN